MTRRVLRGRSRAAAQLTVYPGDLFREKASLRAVRHWRIVDRALR